MAPARLCITVTGKTMAELRERRDAASDADLIELRVDTVRDPSAAAALAGRRKPVIFTCRPMWEGGYFTGSEDERRRLLSDAQRLGAEYIDVEWQARFDDLIATRGGQGVIVSTHDFDGVPVDLATRAATMRGTGAEVVKVSVTAKRLCDCLPLVDLGRASTTPMVLVAMGEAGLPSRVLATRFGSCWSYAGEAAAGQVSACVLRNRYSFRSLSDRTTLYGVVGRPVMHSLSPAMHNAAFKAAEIDAVYLPLAAADFDDLLEFADKLGIQGVSVTSPFKLDAFEAAAECDPVSRRIQSVNTLRRQNDRWIGSNTDVAGFLKPLKAAIAIKGVRATILGAGGAARAAAEALAAAGAHVTISARVPERAQLAASLTGAATVAWPPPPESWDILINATPVGMAPRTDDTPLRGGPFRGKLVYDLIYNPPRTQLLHDAEAAGCRTLGGLDMLVAQAEMQYEWWTGVRPLERSMRDAALSVLEPL